MANGIVGLLANCNGDDMDLLCDESLADPPSAHGACQPGPRPAAGHRPREFRGLEPADGPAAGAGPEPKEADGGAHSDGESQGSLPSYVGVFPRDDRPTFDAYLELGGDAASPPQRIWLGEYVLAADAARAYDSVGREHGLSELNFPDEAPTPSSSGGTPIEIGPSASPSILPAARRSRSFSRVTSDGLQVPGGGGSGGQATAKQGPSGALPLIYRAHGILRRAGRPTSTGRSKFKAVPISLILT